MTISATDIVVLVCSKTPLLYLLTQKTAQKFGYVLGIGGQKPQEREDVAGDAIALPEFWSASGACARKGLAESAYAIKLRLLDATELRVFVA